MKVILLEDVKKVGKRGEIIEVSEAYGRNVLIKKGVGLEGTPQNLNNAKQKLGLKLIKNKWTLMKLLYWLANCRKYLLQSL